MIIKDEGGLSLGHNQFSELFAGGFPLSVVLMVNPLFFEVEHGSDCSGQ